MTDLILFLVGICTITIVVVMVFVVKLSNEFNSLKDLLVNTYGQVVVTDNTLNEFKSETRNCFISSLKNDNSIQDKLVIIDEKINAIDEKVTPKPKIKPRKKSDELSDK